MSDNVRAAASWIGRLLLFCLLLLPRALRRLVSGDPGNGLLLLPLGVLSLLAVLLSTLNEIRVLFLYWWTDDVTPGTWGGPTMAGAWAVHAGLGLLFLPVFIAVMVGIRELANRADTKDGRRAVTVADVLAVAFLVAFVRQL